MIKKFRELNEGADQNINKLSRVLSDYFFPDASKMIYPVKCDGYKDSGEEYEVYFSVWVEEKNDYKSGPITTIFVPKNLI